MVTHEEAVNEILKHAGWTRSEAERVVDELVGSDRWSAEAILLGFRADFKCEYCSRDLLEDANSYKMWERDHLVPETNGGTNDPSNMVLACTLCNVKFKNRWNPVETAASSERHILLEAAREYVSLRREETEKYLARVRDLFRRH